MVKNLPANTGGTKDTGLIPELGRSPGVGNGNPLQYSCLENPIDRGAWQATVHGVIRVGHDLVTEQQQQSYFISRRVSKNFMLLTTSMTWAHADGTDSVTLTSVY